MTSANANTTGVVGLLLAGGQARRLGGGDKCLIRVGACTLLQRIIDRAQAQASPLLINANGDATRFDSFGLPVVGDVLAGHAGPLAGVLTALEWAHDHAPKCSWVASFATDTPFFPLDLVPRLHSAIENETADMACAASNGRTHPVFALWPLSLRGELRAALIDEGIRKIDAWTGRYRVATVDFPVQPHDPFFNVNTQEDLAVARSLIDEIEGQSVA